MTHCLRGAQLLLGAEPLDVGGEALSRDQRAPADLDELNLSGGVVAAYVTDRVQCHHQREFVAESALREAR